MQFNKYFDAIFLVNLDRRPERLKSSCDELSKHNITDILRYPAIDGNEIEYHGKLNAGQIGCTLSHLGIVKYAKEQNLEKIFIFEDDISLADNFNDVMASALSELPDNWDMFYAGGNHLKSFNPFSHHLVKLNGTLTTHAYGIHSRFYDTIINTIEASFNEVIDVYYFILHANSSSYCTNPKIAFQTPGYSDLENREVNYTVLNNVL
jgi:GR25 family glycosyltransferase involved in LPS biosynthesis